MFAPQKQRTKFLVTLAIGLIVAFCLLPIGQDLTCKSYEQHASVPKENAASEQEKGQSNISDTLDKQATEKKQSTNEVRRIHWPMSLLCGEMKLTDLALAFFTYTLAVVGWFTLRSNEQTIEAAERAYVFPGYDPLTFDESGHAKFMLVMTNTGRMPGRIQEIGYAFLKRVELPKRKADADWAWTKIPYDWIIPAATQVQISSRREIRELESPHGGDNTFVCYIKYQDLFSRQIHTSWMGMYIFPNSVERTARAGGDTWNDWD